MGFQEVTIWTVAEMDEEKARHLKEKLEGIKQVESVTYSGGYPYIFKVVTYCEGEFKDWYMSGYAPEGSELVGETMYGVGEKGYSVMDMESQIFENGKKVM